MTPEDMDLLAALGRARAGLKVESDKHYVVESRLALDHGADEYIMKPFDGEIIAAKFAEAGLL